MLRDLFSGLCRFRPSMIVGEILDSRSASTAFFETSGLVRGIRRSFFPATPWRPTHTRRARKTIAGHWTMGYIMRRRNLDGLREYREMDRDEAQRYLFDRPRWHL